MIFDRKVFALALALAAGACAALVGLKLLFPLIPNDLQRVHHLLAALGAPDSGLGVVVFGNSVAMGGVDARVLSAEFPGNPLAYNFAKAGKDPLCPEFRAKRWTDRCTASTST